MVNTHTENDKPDLLIVDDFALDAMDAQQITDQADLLRAMSGVSLVSSGLAPEPTATMQRSHSI